MERSKINKKYLLISLSPYTFFASLLLFILRKKFIYILEVMVTKNTDAIQKFLDHLFIILCLVLLLKYQN